MKNRWKDRDARAILERYKAAGKDLALRTYSARLLGLDSDLVLHGGGNTSVKTVFEEVTGERVPVLCVKGSGWDLDTIEPAGHPAVSLPVNSSGLPVGLQLVGRRGETGRLLAIAAACERMLGRA